MNPTCIHLVRHGEVHNPQKILYGRLPRFRLSANGRRQAAAAGHFLSRLPVQAVYTSPMLRARQTAGEILTCFPQQKLRTSRLLNEVCTAYEGLPGDQVDRRHGDIYTGAEACYEQPGDVFGRLHKFLRRSRRQYPGQHVIAVSHGDVITFAILWARGFEISPRNKNKLRQAGFAASYPAHASITTFTFHSAAADERPGVAYSQPWS